MKQGPASDYHKVRRYVFYFSLMLDFALLIVLTASGLSVMLRDWAFSISSNTWIANGAYLAAFSLLIYVFHLPAHFFKGYSWEHRHGLSTQSVLQWAVDEVKQAALGFVLALILVEFIFFFLAQFPRLWWVYAGALWVILSVVIARILPSVLIPIFYKYIPVESESLREKIRKQFELCNVPLDDIYAINLSSKTKKANAFVCGLGKKRRVVLTDNLLENFSEQEIEAVVAHELGHYCHQDIIKLLAVNSAVIFTGLYLASLCLVSLKDFMGLSSVADIALLPGFLIVMMAFSFLTSPILNGFSRQIEREADEFSLKMTKRPDDFITMMQKLGDLNLAETAPSRFNEIMFFDHPPIEKRIQFAKGFGPQQGGISS